mgnify:CR=1 FL=1
MATRIHIFDVEHGACNVIQTPNDKLIMIDCGHNSTTNWRPSDWIKLNNLTITNLTIANIDEDHVSDLVNIDDKCSPNTIKTNWNLSPEWIEKRKKETGGIGKGVERLIYMMRNKFTGDSVTIDYGLERTRFCHDTSKFDDFNNLSMVTFIKYSNIGILFTGDIEKPAWLEFLRDKTFINCLEQTNIFMASHHGRESGYCEDVFSHCHPDIIIISDKAIEHETQMKDNYAKHASGINFNGKIRKVLTTRKDGKITIDISQPASYLITINS